MSELIHISERPEPHEENAEASMSVYELDVRNVLLGFLYLDPGSYTVTWRGTLDFLKMEKEAFNFLYKQVQGGRRSFFWNSRPTIQAVVSFVIADECHELVEYKLDDPNQYEEYQKVMHNPSRIFFARYDFLVQVSRFVFNCSLTAENPRNTSSHDNELAIRLPRSLPPSEDTLRWIIERHDAAEFLRQRLDLRTSVAALSRLISSRSNSSSTAGEVSFA